MMAVVVIITAILGACVTFFANHQLRQGPVRSSALLSLIVGLTFFHFPTLLPLSFSKNIPVVFIGGSFIGMASKKLINNYLKLVVAALVFSVIYLNTSTFFNGYGGALGASAGIALLSTLSIPFMVSKNKRLSNGILQLRKFIFKRNRH